MTMGNQQNTQPSPTTQQPAGVQATKSKASSFDPAHPTGIAAVDGAALGPCKGDSSGPGCLLDAGQRQALVILFDTAVAEAHSNCKDALVLLHVEQLIKKPDELPWYASLLLSAIAAVATDGLSLLVSGGVGAAAKMLGSEMAAGAGAAIANVNVAKMCALIAISPVSSPSPIAPATVKAAVGKVVDTIKGAVVPGLAKSASANSPAAEQKTVAQGYLEYLGRTMDQKFADLSRKAPSVATDGELVALLGAFAPENHATEIYVARFRGALDRYVHSHAPQIGRRIAWDARHADTRVELETRVAWLITKGAGKRLIYVDRAFDATLQRQIHEAQDGASRGAAYDGGVNQLSLQEEGTWNTPKGSETRHEKALGPDLMLNYVEPELVQLALQAQEHVWLTRPETFMLDYAYAPPRMVKVAS
jgi:hypothetical protein